jgi:hypothetical protein
VHTLVVLCLLPCFQRICLSALGVNILLKAFYNIIIWPLLLSPTRQSKTSSTCEPCRRLGVCAYFGCALSPTLTFGRCRVGLSSENLSQRTGSKHPPKGLLQHNNMAIVTKPNAASTRLGKGECAHCQYTVTKGHISLNRVERKKASDSGTTFQRICLSALGVNILLKAFYNIIIWPLLLSPTPERLCLSR